MTRRRAVISLVFILLLAWGGVVAASLRGATPRLGLDLQGGSSVILTAPEGTDPGVLEKAVEIMRNRIEDLGNVQEPEIAVSGDRNILVQLPGVRERERALDAVGTTGQLSFRPVLEILADSPFSPGTTTTTPTTTTTVPETTTTTASDEETTTTTTATTTTTVPPGIDPETGLTVEDDPQRDAWLPGDSQFGPVVYHVGPARVLGSDVADAQAIFAATSGGPLGVGGIPTWQVSLDLTSDGGDKFADVTAELARYSLGDPRRQFAIVLDGQVVSAPQIAESVDPSTGITGGRASITLGSGDEQAAQDLAVVLRYGALPITLERANVLSVSATLGSDSLQAGLAAGIGGLVLVALALIFYYRALGLVAVLGLTVFGSLIISVFGVLGATQGLTLTLAGVTGIIVSVGITADSYIVYFERIKEEVRKGRTIHSAVHDGFARAFRTTVTADTVSFMGAALLWLLAVGPVKGFALALGIATILDVIVLSFYTRAAVSIVSGTGLGEGGAISIRGAVGRRAEATA